MRCKMFRRKMFICKHFRAYGQRVPMPFGTGNCEEQLGSCEIESESDDCSLECVDYKERGIDVS